MPGLDERLTQELRRLSPASEPALELWREIDRRRGRRRVSRRATAAALAIVVLAGTAGGFTLLRLAFRTGSTPPPIIQPEPPNTPGVGLDVGLPFRLCGVSKLPRVLFGDHTGAVWLAERIGKDGCPDAYEGASIAAADTDGDGLADVWTPFPCRGGCDPSPTGAVDVNADGWSEVFILLTPSSTPQYRILTVVPMFDRDTLAVTVVGAVGHPEAGFRPGRPATFTGGGDEGFAGSIRCQGWPGDTVLSSVWTLHPVDSNGPKEIHRTRFALDTDGVLALVDRSDDTVPTDFVAPAFQRPDRCGPLDLDPLG